MPDLRPEVERKCSPGRAEASFSSFFFRSLDCGFGPASGLGRLPAGGQGMRGASPSTPPTTPVLPLVRVVKGVSVACRVPCPPLAAGGGRRGAGLVSFLPSFLPSFFRWLADVARRLGVVASRRGAGDERGKPLYTPYDPLHPLSAWRRASLSHVVYPVRRSPLGAVGAHLPVLCTGDMRACCGAPALRGSPPRPGLLVGGMFSGLHVERRGVIF